MFPPPTHEWTCQECGHSFLDNAEGIAQCPECKSYKVKGGPIKMDGPYDDQLEEQIRY